MAKARRALEAGHEKSHEFCSAFSTLKVGKAAMAIAESLIQRASQDLLSDGNYKGALEILSCAAPERLFSECEVGGSLRFMSLVPKAGSKLQSTWAEWSKLRAEEQFDDVIEALNNLAHIVEHAAATMTTEVINKCQPLIHTIDGFFEGLPDEATVVSDEALETVMCLSDTAWTLRVSLANAKAELDSCVE